MLKMEDNIQKLVILQDAYELLNERMIDENDKKVVKKLYNMSLQSIVKTIVEQKKFLQSIVKTIVEQKKLEQVKEFVQK